MIYQAQTTHQCGRFEVSKQNQTFHVWHLVNNLEDLSKIPGSSKNFISVFFLKLVKEEKSRNCRPHS